MNLIEHAINDVPKVKLKNVHEIEVSQNLQGSCFRTTKTNLPKY